MVRRAALIGLSLGLAACTEQVVLYDVGDAGSPDLGAGKDGKWAPDATCGLIWKTLTYSPQAADVMVVLDRSASMQKPFAGTTREAAAQSALVNAIGMYQKRIKFGFEQFPAADTDPSCQPGACCAEPVSIDPTLSNGAAMSSGIWCSDPHGGACSFTTTDSPSHAALDRVREYYKSSYSTDDQYVLLVTSSDPSCAAESDMACADARNAASDLGNAGVHLYVLSVGYQPDQGSCLYQVSQIGSSSLPPHTKPLYPANDAYDLTTALSDIFSAVARSACFMTSDYQPPSPALTVYAGSSVPVPQVSGSSQDGWFFSDPRRISITFSGSACDDWVKSQLTRPDVSYSCSSCDGPNACSNWQP